MLHQEVGYPGSHSYSPEKMGRVSVIRPSTCEQECDPSRRAQIVSALFSFFFGSCSQFVLNFFKKFSNVLNFFWQLFSKIFRGFAAHTTNVYHFRHPSTNAFALINIHSSHNKHFYVTISYTFDEYCSSYRTQFLKCTRLKQSQKCP